MTVRVHDLTGSDLARLPAPCRSCLFWEGATGAPTAARVALRFIRPASSSPASSSKDEPAQEKVAWWQASQLEWGAPGKAAYERGSLVGYALFAPVRHFPKLSRLGPLPSDDAILLATMWVAPARRREHIATTLLQAVLRESARRGARALEAYGLRGMTTDPPMGGCVLPEGFLRARGFAPVQDDNRHPLLRLDIRQTARWQESVGHALEEVLGLLGRRERAPAPSPARTAPASTRRIRPPSLWRPLTARRRPRAEPTPPRRGW